jgi:hypothetical protein
MNILPYHCFKRYVNMCVRTCVRLACYLPGGHVHIYQRFYPLRSNPYGPVASKPNNRSVSRTLVTSETIKASRVTGDPQVLKKQFSRLAQ